MFGFDGNLCVFWIIYCRNVFGVVIFCGLFFSYVFFDIIKMLLLKVKYYVGRNNL